jgi:type II secretory pathway component PulF
VAIFEYKAVDKRREDHSETGTVLASTEEEARQKLKRLNLENVRIKRVGAFMGFWRSFSVDVK